MSRTDKDTPFWARFAYAEPFHMCGRARAWQKIHTTCDLPAEPPARSREFYSWYGQRSLMTKCHWVPVGPYDRQTKYIKHKREWRRRLFHGPQRAAVRNAARRVVQGDREVEFPDGRTRHSVHWELW